MCNKFYKAVFFTNIIIALAGCGSSDSTSSDTDIPYSELSSNTGFSTDYLNNKSFFSPGNYQGNDFIEVYQFTNSNVSWSDNLFNTNDSASYTIVSSNGINGIIQYNDGVYDLHYNVFSVEVDHIKVCYTYTGIDTVILCTANQTLNWYFDRTNAEANYP